MTRVKICGITRVEDALCAAEAGADAIGLVFYAKSPRNLSLEQGEVIARALPPFVTTVALFVDPDPELVRAVEARVRPDLHQFHGEETPAFCAAFARPYLKAVRVRQGTDLLQYCALHAGARGLLLDAYVEGVAGGTGHRFDWGLIPAGLPKPVILAGGLGPENVAEAIRHTRPWAVDVSSGVEAAKGIKDARRVHSFMKEVRNADGSIRNL